VSGTEEQRLGADWAPQNRSGAASAAHALRACAGRDVPSCTRQEEAAVGVTDEQWALLEPLVGQLPRRADKRGRPWRDSRDVLNGILWILRTGAQWRALPERYPPYQTCHRRF
jgi:hypothetical protein